MKDLFERGLGYKSFIFNLNRTEREKFIKNQISISIDMECRQKINKITIPVNIIVVVNLENENTYFYLPIIEKLVCTNANIQLRVLMHDIKIDELYVGNALQVPIFLFMDEDYSLVEKLDYRSIIDNNACESEICNVCRVIEGVADIIKKR